MKAEGIDKTLKLQSFMARAGVASRRKCEEIIRQKRVKVNGKLVDRLGVRVSLDDIVTLDGKRITLVEKKCYIAINKPKGYLCSRSDPFGRALVSELLPDEIRKEFRNLFHVGRLDFSTSGLIFYTNDGVFANIVMHPSFEVEKEYLVELKTPLLKEDFEKYKRGIEIEDNFYQLKDYKILGRKKVSLILNEGKNREIRKVLRYLGYEIFSLKRIRIGIVTLEGIPPGGYRYLGTTEIEWFYNRYRRMRI